MTSFERVLVGINDRGAGHAADLAARLMDPDGEVILAHVDAERGLRLHRPHGGGGGDSAARFSAARARIARVDRVSEATRAAASVARGLSELAEEVGADLIVLGLTERSHGGAAAGHTAMRLLQGAPCAVALAPSGKGDENGRFRHVGVAFDGSPEARAALEAAYGTAAQHGAAVSVFWVLPAAPPEGGLQIGDEAERALHAHRRSVQEQLDDAAGSAPTGVNPRTVVLHGEAVAQLKTATSGVVDILFTGSRGYGPLQRVLAGSVAEELIRGAAHPVVVVPRG